MISVQPVTWKLSQKNIILEGLQQLMLLFEISLTGISPFSLIDQLHGNFGLAAAGQSSKAVHEWACVSCLHQLLQSYVGEAISISWLCGISGIKTKC